MAQQTSIQAFNRKLIEDYFATVAGRKTDKSLDQYFTDDVVWYVPKSNPVIIPNPRRGLEAVLDLLGAGVNVYEPGSLLITIKHLIVDSERVVAQFQFQAGLRNGNDFNSDYCFVFTLREGRISEVWEYLDTLYQHQQGVFSEF